MAVTGCNFVRFSRHGLQSIRAVWPHTGDRFEVRRQSLKLRFWDDRHLHPAGTLCDHTYESIKALQGEGIYELRLDDDIGGQTNIRVIFFDPPGNWTPLPSHTKPLRPIWILEVMPKRRNEWTKNDLTRFKAARQLIKTRCYA